jgi:hypothetical protein
LLRAFFFFHSATRSKLSKTNIQRHLEQTLRSRKAYIPAGAFHSKRRGELAELGFMYRVASHGIGVAKPYGDSFPYDFLTQHGKRVLRVQVKSCFMDERDGVNGFNITVARSRGHGKITYEVGDIDFIAAFIAKCDAWYLVPMETVGRKKSIRLYPKKKRYKKGCGLYERYREAWELLMDEGGWLTQRKPRCVGHPPKIYYARQIIMSK